MSVDLMPLYAATVDAVAAGGPWNADQFCRAMQHAVEFKNLDPTPAIQDRIEALVARIRKKAKSLAPDPVFLRCAVEEAPRKLCRVSITLDVPQKTLAVKEE